MTTVGGQFRNLPDGLEIPDGDLVVFSGPNNSGKSSILKYLAQSVADIDYISPRRFDVSSEMSIEPNAEQQRQSLFQQRRQDNPNESEKQAPEPFRELISMSNADRQRVIDWHNRYFGALSIERLDPSNDFSAPRILADGRILPQQGSGSRAVLSVLVRLLDPRLPALCIDEPEIGIEPVTQRRLFELIQKVVHAEEGLPKKRVYLATHSHLFIDKETIGNNYVVESLNGAAAIRRIESTAELQTLIFRLLGNAPADLFFANNIIVVEGRSDEVFLHKVLELEDARGQGIDFHFAGGDGSIRQALSAIDQVFRVAAYTSLYRERLCAIVDKQVDPDRIREWKEFMGARADERLLVLESAAIEYEYPRATLSQVTGVAERELEDAIRRYLASTENGQAGTLGSFKGRKVELAFLVAARMNTQSLDHVSGKIRGVLKLAKDLAISKG
jgi:predicted ATPase